MKAPMNTRVTRRRICCVDDAFPRIYNGMCEYNFSDGSFSFIEVIEYIWRKTGKANVDVSTWVASTASTQLIEDFVQDSTQHHMRFLVDVGFKNTRKKLFNYINSLHGDVIRVTRNHAKFCLIYNNDWNFVVETSANLNKNKRLENFRITEHKQYREFFSDLFDSFFKCDAETRPYQQLDNALR